MDIHNDMLNMLECVEYTHSYIFTVYNNKGDMFACVYKNACEVLHKVTTLGAHNGHTTVKMLPTRANMDYLMDNADMLISLGTRKDFECGAKWYKARWHLNRGYYNEVVVCKAMHGKLVTCKNACLTDCGDMVVDGVHYQLKYFNATVCHENRLANMLMRKV